MTKMIDKFRQKSNKTIRTYLLVAVGLIVFLPLLVLFIKNIQINKVRKDYKKEKEFVQKNLEMQVDTMMRSNIALFTKPLVWSFRSELIRENQEQMSLYLYDFVKEKGLRMIVVTDNDGTIIASSDKKIEGEKASNAFPGLNWNPKETEISEKEGAYYCVTPMMGLSNSIGTVLTIVEKNNLKLRFSNDQD